MVKIPSDDIIRRARITKNKKGSIDDIIRRARITKNKKGSIDEK